MVEYFPLDKILVQGEEYQMAADRFYVIKKIGTDADADTFLDVDGIDTGAIIEAVAPIRKKDTNRLGVLDLGDLYYVVPPLKKFHVEGPTGAKYRVVGQIGKLAIGEAIPAHFAGRFAEQGKHYLTYITGTYSLGTDVKWVKDAEYEVFSLTPKTIEEYVFNNVLQAKITGDTVAEGDFGIILYLNGVPQDILTKEPGRRGLDVLSLPKPPTDTTEMEPFTLKQTPIKVLGDHTISIKAMNVSGADKTPATGATWKIDILAVVEYLMKA